MELTLIGTNFTQQSTTSSNFANSEPYFVSSIPPPPPPASSAHLPPLHDRHSSDVDLFATNLEQGRTLIDAYETPIPNRENQLTDIHTQEEEEEEEEEEEDVRGCLLGVKRKALQEMHDLYKTHGREFGFSVLKSTSRENYNGVLYTQLFVCSCEGFRQNKGSKKKYPITRTGCGPAMNAELNDNEGCFVVSRHDTAHNHAFTRMEWGDRHRSEKKNFGRERESHRRYDRFWNESDGFLSLYVARSRWRREHWSHGKRPSELC